MKRIILFSLLLVIAIKAQPGDRIPYPVLKYIFNSDMLVIPSTDSSVSVYYLYKIAYKELVFEKAGKNYVGNVRLQIEIFDSSKSMVLRELKDNGISVENFEITIDKNNFLYDVIHFELPSGNYEVRPTISDLNSDRELPLKPDIINSSIILKETIFNPVVINHHQVKCDSKQYYSLVNFDGSIPFSPNQFSLLIPVADSSENNLNVQIISETDTILFENLRASSSMNLTPERCGENIILNSGNQNISTRNFILENVNKNLFEGRLTLRINIGDESQNRDIEMNVVWVNKPFSLFDPEQAITLLKYIESDEVISELLNADDADYSQALIDYWKKFDPEPETSFNPLMQEYYERIDYAALEFRGLGKDNGTNTDRGKIYIRFGKPNEISRTSDTSGNVVETWIYANPEKKFTFVDTRGTGNFTLVEG